MAEIKDFTCTYDNAAGINEETAKRLKLTFPDAYLHWESMAQIASALKEYEGADFCALPFCHTVEAEAMGGLVNYGNEKTGPRAKEYILSSMEEFLELPAIDYSAGRIHEVLLACSHLREQGEDVVLEIAGPFTILNVLVDPKYAFKAMRRQPELMEKVFGKFEEELLRYIAEAIKYGVNIISYADSAGGVNILGPKMAAQVVEAFTYDFLKKAEELIGDEAVIQLCPKTTLMLMGTEKARYREVSLGSSMRYGSACAAMAGKEKFTGQMCIKNISYTLTDQKLKAVSLL